MYIFDLGMKVRVVEFNEVGNIVNVKVGEDNNTLYEVQTPDGVRAWFTAVEIEEYKKKSFNIEFSEDELETLFEALSWCCSEHPSFADEEKEREEAILQKIYNVIKTVEVN